MFSSVSLARAKTLSKTQISLLARKLLTLGKRSAFNLLAIAIIIGMNSLGLFAVGRTICHFNDTETSPANVLTAATLDFRLTNTEENEYIGVEVDGELKFTTVAIQEAGSLDIQYEMKAEKMGGDDAFCDGINLIAKRNGMQEYSGKILEFVATPSTTFGVWEFELDAPPLPGDFAHGDKCEVDLVFSGWREDVAEFDQSGFTDEERFSLDLTARMIVLNEVLAYPDTSQSHPADKEFIELKNNGNAPVDVEGWKISEMTSSGTENKYTITTAGGSFTASPDGGSTIIPAGAWLVLFLSNGTALNNDGDTICLYDNNDNKLDEYSYETAKYGMSDARYLDGIGFWVDPIPTPGGANILEEGELPSQFATEDANDGVAGEGVNDETVGDEVTETGGTIETTEETEGGAETADEEVVSETVSEEVTTEPLVVEGEATEEPPVGGETAEATNPPTVDGQEETTEEETAGETEEGAETADEAAAATDPPVVDGQEETEAVGEATDPPVVDGQEETAEEVAGEAEGMAEVVEEEYPPVGGEEDGTVEEETPTEEPAVAESFGVATEDPPVVEEPPVEELAEETKEEEPPVEEVTDPSVEEPVEEEPLVEEPAGGEDVPATT